ncbi:hypothetical protein Tco_0438190 [Tanacetum coccineum]
MPLTTVPIVMKHVQSMSSSVTPNVPKPLGKLKPLDPTVMQSHSETVYPRPINQLSEITESVYLDHPRLQHKYSKCPAPALQQARPL